MLGIVLVTDEAIIAELEEGACNLSTPSGEVKSGSVLGGSKDIWKVLRRQETTDFLKLLDGNGIAVHYHAQSNFYYAIVGIVGSLLVMPAHRTMAMLHRQLKNE